MPAPSGDVPAALRDAVPLIRTARLVLRAPRLEDAESVVAYMAQPRSHMDGGPLDADATWDLLFRGAGQWLLRGYGYWHVDDAATGCFVARIGLFHPPSWPEPELAWAVIAPEAEGKGIALEGALAARAAAARIWSITRPISSIKAANDRSIRLAERMGARFEAVRDTIYGPMQIWRHPETLPEVAA